MYRIKKLANLINGRIIQLKNNFEINYLLNDSRRAIINDNALFFSISGAMHDGHYFINALYKEGLRNFIIEDKRKIDISSLTDANIIQVDNSINALQTIAKAHRQQFKIPVVGITGSNGKTIVKEWLSQLLSGKHQVVRSPKSYNSQIGVPLSVWQMQKNDQIGVFEAGISCPGEMEKLEKIIQPAIGIFTNIGPAHDEGFKNRRQKVEEKCKLFKDCHHIIFSSDYTDITSYFEQYTNDLQQEIFVWGFQKEKIPEFGKYKMFVEEEIFEAGGSKLKINYSVKGFEEQIFTIKIPFKDHASIENCLHCIAFLMLQNFPIDQIQKGLNGLRPINMRLELKAGINNCTIIDDSYNNDLAGIRMALDFMDQQNHRQNKTVILSDVYQTGLHPEKLRKQLGNLLKDKKINKFIGIGPEIMSSDRFLPESIISSYYQDTFSFLSDYPLKNFQNELILIKGARNFSFENIVKRLQQKIHGTTLEINLDAISHNLNFYRSKLNTGTKILVMVKAFSYGGSSFEIANLLQFHRVNYLGVAYADEGVNLRNHGITLPILVLNPSPDSFYNMIQNQLEPEVYSTGLLRQFLNISNTYPEGQQKLKIHIKIDTGMHRLGFQEEELDKLIEMLIMYPSIEVGSIFTHLAAADEEVHDKFSHDQVNIFNRCYEKISSAINRRPIRHILNSAGIIRFPEYQYDMVRLGIGLYGVEVTGSAQDQLEPVSTLKTIISQIKHVKKGESVGYGRRGKVDKPMKIATIAIGYADGFDRGLSNGKINVYVNGKPAPTIGNICMDMAMIDITGIDAEEGDEVIIFGKEQPITALARAIETIPYEILTNVSERVKRVFYTG